MIHLCMEKTLHCARFYLNWFQIFDQIWTKRLDQIWNKLDQKICTHYIAEKFDKSQKRILLITFCFSFFQLIFVIFDLFPQSFLFLNDITNPAYQVWGRN